MIRFFQWLDDVLSQAVPLLYLAGLIVSTVAYFGGAISVASVAVAIGLGSAVEIHAWLQQRRFRAALAVLSRLSAKDPRREIAVRQLRWHGLALAALVAFQAWNSNLFLSVFWHPSTTVVPLWVQWVIRGSIIPLFFLLTALLVPLEEDHAHFLNRVLGHDLRNVLAAHRKDLKRRIAAIRARKGNLTPVVVAMATDLGEPDVARRMRLIDQGISDAEEDAGLGQWVGGPMGAPGAGYYVPPTGGGSPAAAPAEDEGGYGESIQLVPPMPVPRTRPRRRVSASESADRAEAMVRSLLSAHPDMPVNEICRRAHVNFGRAGELRRQIRAEMGLDRPAAGRGKMAR